MSKLDRYKLDTSFSDTCVTHTTYKTDLAAGQRKTAVQATWTDQKTLGSGGFGIVMLQKEDGGELRAVKRIMKGVGNIDYSRELTVMSKVAHHEDLFVKFLGWYENNYCVFIAMEYIEHGDLSHYLKNSDPHPAGNAREITRQLLKGLVVLHDLNITHRDLKPQNILIASLHPIWVKIADFGVSKRAQGTVLHTLVASQGYVAPEVIGLVPRMPADAYSNAVDMWALGCVVHQLLTMEVPFQEIQGIETMTGLTPNNEELLTQTDVFALKSFCDSITELPTDSLRQSGANDEAVEFLKCLLVANPISRPAAKEALQAAWILQEDLEMDTCRPVGSPVLQATAELTIIMSQPRVHLNGSSSRVPSIHNGVVSVQPAVVERITAGETIVLANNPGTSRPFSSYFKY